MAADGRATKNARLTGLKAGQAPDLNRAPFNLSGASLRWPPLQRFAQRGNDQIAKYRNQLPQLSDRLFLTDSGLETTLIFHDGIDLPLFASFDLMTRADGRARLRDYFKRHIAITRQNTAGFIFESPT